MPDSTELLLRTVAISLALVLALHGLALGRRPRLALLPLLACLASYLVCSAPGALCLSEAWLAPLLLASVMFPVAHWWLAHTAFADRNDESGEHYFLMDRSEELPDEAVPDMENVYIERDDQCWGGYGGIERVVLGRGSLTLHLGEWMATRMGGHEVIRVSFDVPDSDGLSPRSEVLVRGVHVGDVESVSVHEDSARVEIAVDDRYAPLRSAPNRSRKRRWSRSRRSPTSRGSIG